MNDAYSGLLLLNKPSGVTSYDAVRLTKRALRMRRVGHCGTLDPLARGLLMILIGQSTRLQDTFLPLEKQYRFIAEFGRRTETGDREGRVVEEKAWDSVTRERLEDTLRRFVGPIEQVPPAYAALKYKGKPYYAYARKGLDVPRAPRPVTVYEFILVGMTLPRWEASVRCSRGTYVRSLVEDVSARLNTCGTLIDLVRERVGPYRLDDALPWDVLRTATAEVLLPYLQSPLRPAFNAHA